MTRDAWRDAEERTLLPREKILMTREQEIRQAKQ